MKKNVTNLDGIQFANIRKTLDLTYVAVHDELTSCYYNKQPFRTYGILDKRTFDLLHGLIFHMYFIAFHEANLLLPVKDQIPQEKYNSVNPITGLTRVEQTKEIITQLTIQNIKLVC